LIAFVIILFFEISSLWKEVKKPNTDKYNLYLLNINLKNEHVYDYICWDEMSWIQSRWGGWYMMVLFPHRIKRKMV